MTGAFLLGLLVGGCVGVALTTCLFLAIGWFRGDVCEWSPLDSCRAPPPGYDHKRFKQ